MTSEEGVRLCQLCLIQFKPSQYVQMQSAEDRNTAASAHLSECCVHVHVSGCGYRFCHVARVWECVSLATVSRIDLFRRWDSCLRDSPLSHWDAVPEQSALTIVFVLWEHLFYLLANGWLKLGDCKCHCRRCVCVCVCIYERKQVKNGGARAKVYAFTLIWCAL